MSRLIHQRVELVTAFRIRKCLVFLLLFCTTSLSNRVFAQSATQNLGPTRRHGAGEIDIHVMGADGGPIEVPATVTLVAATGQVLRQGTTLSGTIEFGSVAAGAYTIQVIAPGYESVAKEFRPFDAGISTIIIDMRPALGKTGARPSQMLLAPKVQKELGKAL